MFHFDCRALLWVMVPVVGLLNAIPSWCSAAAPADLPADHAERMTKGLALFDKEVAALLKQHCVKCHGGDSVKGELDLATREGLLKGGETGPAVVPFQAKQSLLHKLITHADEPAMPDKAPKLADADIAKITSWIDQGAPYSQPLVAPGKGVKKNSVVTAEDKQWWAFLPLANVTPPVVSDAAVRTDVDRFIAAKAASKKLTLAPPADKAKLIRRAYLDLLGLPPTPAEVTAFVQDESPDAWPKLIDKLLDSPHYGERWARHWLDVARFAESHGFEHDYDRPGAWAYRDFVIKALNADMSYWQFLKWQLAGDEFAPDDPLALSATGFLGAGVFPTQITANEVERTRYDALDDMLSTTGQAFLGLTVGCARCHDHKYDPIPSADYYRMLSTFTTTVRSNIEVNLDPKKSEPSQRWEAERERLVTAVKGRTESLRPQFDAWLRKTPTELPAAAWTVLDLRQIKSQAGATFKKLDDGSYLAEGTNGAHDEYVLVAETTARKITGLKLDALAHSSMVKGGPGRAGNGNFGLSKITVTAAPRSGGAPQAVKIVKAVATFEQNNKNLSIAATLDDAPNTGWAVDPQFGKDHAAVFTFAEPVDIDGGAVLTVTLDFRVNTHHNIGRPRLSLTTAAVPELEGQSVPKNVGDILKKIQACTTAEKLSEAQRETLFGWWRQQDAEYAKLAAAMKTHDTQKPKTLTTILICGEGYKPMRHHTQGADFFDKTYILERGSTDKKGAVATQSFLQVLMPTADAEPQWHWEPPAGAKFSGRRRSLANWLCDTEKGAGALAARVMVNRLWQHHFGAGIVSTPNDFGKTGTLPTHPELLDWLARELIRHEGRLKPLHKLLMTSGVYLQSTAAEPAKEQADPGNQLWVRRLPRRLEAEPIRDCMLAVAGKLDRTMYGPGTKDEKSVRRSVYFTIKRSQLIGSMVVFDAPEPLVSQGSRPTTTVAPQALLVLNGPQVRTWAEAFAARVLSETAAPSDWPNIAAQVYSLALNRAPTAAESAAATKYLQHMTDVYSAAKQADPRSTALADFCQVVFGLNEFVYEE